MNSLHASVLASTALLRYPRTIHLEGSRLQTGDEPGVQRLADLAGSHVVVEEKIDGANCAVSFTANGGLLLQSRGHYLMGGARERQFSPLHVWANTHADRLFERLGDRYVMYGEWAYAKHSVFYDRLPHYFHEFDVWDRQTSCFLSTPRRQDLLAGLPVLSVPVLYAGPMPVQARLLWSLVRHSLAKSNHWKVRFEQALAQHRQDTATGWRQTDASDLAEGLYLKQEDENGVRGRFKLVRPDFVQTILDSGSHHSERPTLPNQLSAGVDLYAPQLTLSWEHLGLVTLFGLDALREAMADRTQDQRRIRRNKP